MKLLLISFIFVGCTDATWDSYIGKLGVKAEITCFSGGQKIFHGKSTGAVQSPSNSDGYQFRRQSNGKFMEVSGECIIEYDDD